MFNGQFVEHLTSWLTINPYKGCPLSCAYCFRARWHPSEKPEESYDVTQAVDSLVKHPDFRPHQTPVSINNSSTDPLLQSVRQSTFKAIEVLETRKLRNPFAIISKLELKYEELEFLKHLQFVRPLVFVSLSLIPRHIEPAPIVPRMRNLRKLSQTNIPTVLYFRPIVEGWNDSKETIKVALSVGEKYCDAICIGSLRISREIRAELQNRGVQIENYKDDFHSKEFSNNIQDRILEIYDRMNLKTPLFKHSSCAVSYFMRTANYNLLFHNPIKNCLRTCPASQQNLCRPQN